MTTQENEWYATYVVLRLLEGREPTEKETVSIGPNLYYQDLEDIQEWIDAS